MGFDGTTVTPEIRQLIEQHHLGSILLTAKNLKCEILDVTSPFTWRDHWTLKKYGLST